MSEPTSSAAARLARMWLAITWLAFTWLAAALLLAWLAWAAVHHALPFASARPDPETGTPGLLVETDAGTGCQYIVTPWGGVVARTGADGRQICTRRP